MYRKIFKRVIDIVLALIALIVLAVLFIPITLILLLTGEHHIFYLQERVGYKNRFFHIIKFATMLKNSPNMGSGSLTLRNDPRVLPFGKFLRKTKINELPQIINVLLGEMSIVGPRPQMEVDFLKFSEKVQKIIYDTPPGITGIGSIFFRDEEKWISGADGDKHEFYRDYIAPYKGELEIWYLSHIAFYTDMMMIFLTAWVIIFHNSPLPYKVFKDLPDPPQELKTLEPRLDIHYKQKHYK